MFYAKFSMCPLYTLQRVSVLLKSGHSVYGSTVIFLLGEYGLNSKLGV